MLGTKSVMHVSSSVYTRIPFQTQLGRLLLLEAFPDLPGWVNCLLWAPAAPLSSPVPVLPTLNRHCLGTGLSSPQ